ncbi:C2 family cysteine protease [Luteimonas panaciterrae]|uniref:C2 family cysteine protease n=1 Tax=Luteimonas panaciterrae TaxID=363885 RepID=UPI001CFB8338|nr:C2 family cysteine protease [Luteimonas panaciterrae]
MAEPRFTDKTLYGTSGHPRMSDINQDSIGDCYFVAPLGALAEQQPSRVENAIQYNADKNTFTVTLYKEEGTGPLGLFGTEVKPVKIEVTQAELEYNLKRGGGSTVDNNPGTNGPIWPAVMETAFAKMHDSDPKDGLKEGFDAIEGGKSYNANFALTGLKSETVSASSIDSMGMDEALKKIDGAMKEHRPVSLSTDPEKTSSLFGLVGTDAPQDGLVDNHVYMVEKIYKDTNGDVQVQVRNPWASNAGVGEGHDTPNASITVKLKDIVDGGGLEMFDIGPKPTEKPTLAQATTGDRHVDAMLASLDNPAAMRESMKTLAASADAQAFVADGRAQADQQQAAAEVKPAEPAPAQTTPAMRM